MNIYWMDRKKLNQTIKQKILPTAVVLDIGCGIRPQKLVNSHVHICVEPFGQYVKKLQEIIRLKKDQEKYVVIQSDWENAVKIFPPYSVDTIFLIDVIEHLGKRKGLSLLKQTEKIARKQIIIFTPLGFLEQKHPDGKDAWGMDGGKMQEHHSGWEPEDFDSSWDVYVTEKFHKTDNMGHFYKKSHGAFYAIKNIKETKKQALSLKERTYEGLNDWYCKFTKRLKKYVSQKTDNK